MSDDIEYRGYSLRLVRSLSPRIRGVSYDICDDEGIVRASTDWLATKEYAKDDAIWLVDRLIEIRESPEEEA